MLPSQQVIDELKKEYGQIFAVGDYLIRKLTMREFDVVQSMDVVDAEDEIVSLAVVWPEDTDTMPAGAFASIAAEVMDVSGFTNPKLLLDEARLKALEVRHMMRAFVLAVDERVNEDDLDDLTLDQLAFKVAMSENIMDIQKALYDPNVEVKMNIVDPDEVEEEDNEAQGEEWDKLNRGSFNSADTGSRLGTATVDDPIAQKLKESMG